MQSLFVFIRQVHPYGSNLSNKEWNGNYGPLRPHAFIPPTVHTHTFAHLHHSSPTHNSAAPHAHTLLSYPSSGPLTTAHHPILPSRPPPPPLLQHGFGLSHPQGGALVHQVTLGIGTHPHHPGHPAAPHRLLPSPTINPHLQPGYVHHPHQFKPPFPPHPYMASPATFTGFPLSPTKLNHQFSYIWGAGRRRSSSTSCTAGWRGNGPGPRPGQEDPPAEHITNSCDDEEKTRRRKKIWIIIDGLRRRKNVWTCFEVKVSASVIWRVYMSRVVDHVCNFSCERLPVKSRQPVEETAKLQVNGFILTIRKFSLWTCALQITSCHQL